jgi:phenylalanyl-tRNA synthetase alpha chain
VGACLAELAGAFTGFSPIDLPEELDLAHAEKTLGGDAVYIDRASLQRIDGERVLRYDLTLPLLLAVRYEGKPLKLRAAGKVYRRERETATHLEAFHQLELFVADERGALDCFWLAGRILSAVDRVLPRSEFRMTPTDYPMCARAFSLDVRKDEQWIEVMAWGEYAPWVLRAIGADPDRHTALGAGFGLERLATLRYGIDDIRKVATTSVA